MRDLVTARVANRTAEKVIPASLPGDGKGAGADDGLAAAATEAAVLVPLVDRADGMTVLLTRRTEHLNDHAGQISFPGGRVEAGDRDAIACALREAEEEIGLSRARIEVIGCLDTCVTGTGFSVVPVVGLIAAPLDLARDLTLDRFEVAEAFEVPLAFVLDPRNHVRCSAVARGRQRIFYALSYGERCIWGATARMLVNLHEVLRGAP